MIKHIFSIKKYWKVIVYYNIDYDFFAPVEKALEYAGITTAEVKDIYAAMTKGRAKAFTFSNIQKHLSITGFNSHDNIYDYLNSIVHEAEHIKQAILNAYHITDYGELPAYTIGYIVMKMLQLNNQT